MTKVEKSLDLSHKLSSFRSEKTYRVITRHLNPQEDFL